MNHLRSTMTLLTTVLAVCWSGMVVASGDLRELRQELSSTPVPWGESTKGPLCGVRSAVTAMALLGTKANVSDYVSTSFVPSNKGSSSREIESIFRKNNIECTTLGGLSALDLYCIDGCVVANVRANPASPAFDHWVTVKRQGSSLMIYDGEGLGHSIRTSDFLAIWNGAAVIASPRWTVKRSLWAARIALVQLCILLLLLVRRTGRQLLPTPTSVTAQLTFILVLSQGNRTSKVFFRRKFCVTWFRDKG